MTTLHKGDDDLHYEDGTHRGTPPTTDGHQLDLYEARIRRHLAEHATEVRLHGQTAREWAVELFEYELCDECHGDVDDHEYGVLLGNWFAKCKKGGTDE